MKKAGFAEREVFEFDSIVPTFLSVTFGDPATNSKGWYQKSLRELGKVVTGRTPPSAKQGMFGGAMPFITPGDLESAEPVRRGVTEAGAKESITVGPGATLVCCIGATIGKIGRVYVRSAFNQQINAVDWGEKVDGSYGFAVLRFFKPAIVAWGTSTTLPILKKSSFEQIEIPVPPLTEQRQFAARVAETEGLRRLGRGSLSVASELFASLQHRAFRGEL